MRGRNVIVTGAAGGIGRAAADRFAMAGARVLGLDIKAGVAAIGQGSAGPGLTGRCCDLTDPGQIEAALAEWLPDGHVDVLVNNAGINPAPATLPETSEAIWLRLIETNLTATYRMTRIVLARMRQGTTGRERQDAADAAPPGGRQDAIVNVASILALGGARGNAAYAATKGALLSLTRALARDHGPGIRVNCVCPGAVETGMFETYLARCEHPERERARIREALPLRRLGRPEDIAEAIYFLASDRASWITGQMLVVDGGDTA